ncbi:SDR family NAD(P)-dependent oxidoreductase [Parvularcula sp. LCG005]|uniref:SDR family NAD(P)-dependent oxidoreductase n=1 Tax=Parvularcula sp. LCG005 TaxID=3078805 RepID=UPI002942A81F|nr:SDR family NAD(P)-dependent oxidoreductase [Parvularcula sp. LCG005]WOI53264.1 SDR family NAD(P)-dependent oxidoreductase [Parvularcula sp. LCG005]
MTIRFDDRIALITGAGGGLGRDYALALAARGATVIVNDRGADRDGTGASSSPAEKVVAEIEAAGGQGMADDTDVTDEAAVESLMGRVRQTFGRLDIIVNNAGILRDRSLHKMSTGDFDAVLDVHLKGSFLVTRAAWEMMRDRGFGRVVFTTSSSGLYGQFGQSNYAAAKMGLVGMMNTLHLEGQKYDIRVNCITPTALTRMTADLGIPDAAAEALTPDAVTPALLFLLSDDAPSRMILSAGAGGYAVTKIQDTDGIYLPEDQRTPENIAAQLGDLTDSSHMNEHQMGAQQSAHFLTKAMAAKNR